MSKASEYVKRAHDKQLRTGWKRLGLRLSPEAWMDLDREMARTGVKAGAIITELLKKTRPQ
jgi:hypothetical protein